ncbi:cystine transporter permease [Pontibacillus marinus BH030004 = DSM 16465]|uniref:Cystine transporter permease n=2 Tax=Pontibacillus TaxID=289201 RepID=A0A0A5GG12_9BACI|nr:cystine transporter permease [Pontibacillus marinus BH030004 = DSM 16465]
MELKGMIDFFETLLNSSDVFLKAAQWTLALTVISIFIAVFIGLFFAFLKISNIKPLEWIANAYIYLVRGTPLIVQIFIFYYGLTEIWMINAFWSAALGLAFHNGAYIAEIFRGSIQSIGKGQSEAGRSLGMNRATTMRRIILPQALRRAMPPLGNQFIIGLKDSSLAAFIGVAELFGVSTTKGANTFDYMTWLLVGAIWYLILVFIVTLLMNVVEKKMAASD